MESSYISIGYFQSVKKKLIWKQLNRLGLRFCSHVRLVVEAFYMNMNLHIASLLSEDYPDMPATVTEAYRVLSEGLLLGFQNLGLDAYFSVPDTDEKRTDLKKPKAQFVLMRQVGMNLVVEGKKVAGSAQTRQKGVILQHGAILLDLDEDKLIQTFKFASEA